MNTRGAASAARSSAATRAGVSSAMSSASLFSAKPAPTTTSLCWSALRAPWVFPPACICTGTDRYRYRYRCRYVCRRWLPAGCRNRQPARAAGASGEAADRATVQYAALERRLYPALCCVCMPTRARARRALLCCRFRADAGKRRLKQSTLSSLAEPAPDLPHGRPAWCSFWIHECGQSSELTQPFCILRTRHQDPVPGASAIKFQRPGCWTGCTDHHPATKCCGQPE